VGKLPRVRVLSSPLVDLLFNPAFVVQ
jgi:hypothetical protein